MSLFKREPKRELGNKVGVLLMNLGTPERADAAAVRPYLREFLSDPRVVELPRLIWQPLLCGVILPFRPKTSAANYQKIWTEHGSPLEVILQQQTAAVADYFACHGKDVTVDYAMTYGQPNIAERMEAFKQQGIGRVLVLPLYPQYSSSATGAAFDKLFADMRQQRNVPSLRTLSRYGQHAGYIAALSQHIRCHAPGLHGYDKVLFSYHGIPQAHVDDGDPYPDECAATSSLLAQHLGLDEAHCITAYQSRFGRAKWIEPSTQTLLQTLPKQGARRIAVFCPGFSADCLETLEEIAISGKKLFLDNGGEVFDFVPCINTDAAWIEALSLMIAQELAGWLA